MKNPYEVIKQRYITEKATLLQELQSATSNKSLARCKKSKYTFLVAAKATRGQVATAIEEIYQEQGIRVIKVNTITKKPKPKRMRGILGTQSGFKKAIVTLEEGQRIDDDKKV